MIRRRTHELMDAPDVEPAAHAQALWTLNRVNQALGVDASLRRAIETVGGSDLISVLDLGSGGGGFLAFLGRRTDGHSPRLLIGLDRSAQALQCAGKWHGSRQMGVVADARRLPLADESVDVVTCSLFVHHFDADDAVTILHEAARVARRGLVVGDLSRSWIAWVATWIGTRLLGRSRLFHVDGPRSVRAAYSASELRRLAEQAKLQGAGVQRQFPFRLMLTWSKRRVLP